jgi:hypothetical protein
VKPARLVGYFDLSDATRTVMRPWSGIVSILILKPLPSLCAHALRIRLLASLETPTYFVAAGRTYQ